MPQDEQSDFAAPASARATIPFIVGPTAIGKTSVALAMGSRHPLTIISADSRQIYRGLDIGTAKPTVRERSVVPHRGIDLIDPGETFSAGKFARCATGWLTHRVPERQPVVVGGTGLYIKALTDGLFRQPYMPDDVLRRVRRWVNTLSDVDRWARRLDPSYMPGGRQRAARAVEVALVTGSPLSWWQRTRPGVARVNPWFVRLTLPRDVLHARIESRVHEMMAAGWIDEVRLLLEGGVSADAPGLDAVGYREIVWHLQGHLSRQDLAQVVIERTRQYAKRQETWFRHQLDPHRVLTVEATDSSEAIGRLILDAWQKEN